MLRKIRKDELKQTAMTEAECFVDYPVYDVFFEGAKDRKACIYYLFWYRLYTMMNYTYVTEDLSMVISARKPGDRDRSPIGIFLNPKFLIGVLRCVPLKFIPAVIDFEKMEKAGQKKFYDPEKDTYIQAVGVLKKSRAGGNFFKEIEFLDDGSPAYCETQTDKNARLYGMLGFQTCGTETWHGIKHYIMHRDARSSRTAGKKDEAFAH